jgi:glyoxylase-like metal-dependent hydrolase (beta-lactamase superfamily II)
MLRRTVPVTPFQQNCTLLACPTTKKAAVIDPGGDVERIEAALAQEGFTAEVILLTHAHVDHAAGAAELARRAACPIVGPQREDEFWIEALPEQARSFGLSGAETFTPERWLEDGDRVSVGEEELEVLHTPGHTPGHVVFFHRKSELLVVGDVLFQGSIGRTDFPRGDYDTLIRSIKERLLPLGDGVAFTCGHGPDSTLGAERTSNPFLVDSDKYRGLV